MYDIYTIIKNSMFQLCFKEKRINTSFREKLISIYFISSLKFALKEILIKYIACIFSNLVRLIMHDNVIRGMQSNLPLKEKVEIFRSSIESYSIFAYLRTVSCIAL